MVANIQSHIHSLNWSYRTDLRSAGVKYINGLAEFIDPHAIKVRMNLCTYAHVYVCVCVIFSTKLRMEQSL